MRKRSNTVYASSIEELTKKLSSSPVEKGRGASQRSLSPEKKRIQKTPSQLSIGVSNENRALKTGESTEDSNWADFDFNNSDMSPVLRKTSFSSKANLTENDDCASPQIRKNLVTKKIMVIGSRGAGKHQTLNSAFQSQDGKDLVPLQQTMDFILKTEEEGSIQTKYHFWIRELNDHKFDSVIKVYYRTISMFIFMYSVTDRSSFEALEEAIEAVRKEVPKEKFVGVLIANKGDEGRIREVSHAEEISLKEKFNLTHFIDASNDEVMLRQNLLEVLNH
jgi:GTPase SAR1 family protein